MTLHLHNPVNQAHLEDLKDRLASHLAMAPVDPYNRMWVPTVVATLVDVVRAMDRGLVSLDDAEAVFGQFRVPGFSLAAWLAEMVDEGVYVEAALDRAA